jgi:DNA-binding MarR family transcriptional regulator
MQKDSFNRYSFLLDCTARRVKQYAQIQFNNRDFGITVDQWTILKALNTYPDLSQKELAEHCGKDQPTLTRIVDLLVKKGYVERAMHHLDRRSFIVHLSKAGKDKVDELEPKIRKIRMKAWENLEENDFQDLKRILDTIYNNLEIEQK